MIFTGGINVWFEQSWWQFLETRVFHAATSFKVSCEQRCQFVNCCLRILALGMENNLVALLNAKREHREDRLRIHFLLVFLQRYLTLEALRVLHKNSRRAGMQSRFAPNSNRSFHHVFWHMHSFNHS